LHGMIHQSDQHDEPSTSNWNPVITPVLKQWLEQHRTVKASVNYNTIVHIG